MKCELCGYELVQFIQNVSQKKYKHMLPDTCALRHLPIMWEADVMAINAAIIEARKDTRRPEECKFHKFHAIGRRPYCLIIDPLEPITGFDTKQIMCPCAAWEKEENKDDR